MPPFSVTRSGSRFAVACAIVPASESSAMRRVPQRRSMSQSGSNVKSAAAPRVVRRYRIGTRRPTVTVGET